MDVEKDVIEVDMDEADLAIDEEIGTNVEARR
jgi:hypothetical protein